MIPEITPNPCCLWLFCNVYWWMFIAFTVIFVFRCLFPHFVHLDMVREMILHFSERTSDLQKNIISHIEWLVLVLVLWPLFPVCLVCSQPQLRSNNILDTSHSGWLTLNEKSLNKKFSSSFWHLPDKSTCKFIVNWKSQMPNALYVWKLLLIRQYLLGQLPGCSLWIFVEWNGFRMNYN